MSTIEQFRAALDRDRPVTGLWATIPSPLTAEALAAAGPDYVVVDEQHGAVGPEALLAMLGAIAARGAAPLVRVAANEPFVIGRALDLGAAGVIVPLVEDAEQAARAVAACRYAPEGSRSYGPLRAPVAQGSADPDVLGAAVCLVMVETRAGLEAVEEIAATPGLDGVYVGPSDLSLSLGVRPAPQLRHPTVRAALDRVRAACDAAGVHCGVHCLTAEEAAEQIAGGHSPVTAGTDLAFVHAGAARALARARGRLMPAVILREVEPDDLPAFFEDQRDPASVAMASVPARDRTAFDAHWAQILVRPDSIIRAVVADGQLAGNVVSWRAEDGRRFIGYWLTRTHWGRGIASAALEQFLALIEERPLFAITVEHNAASQRVLTRNGFVPDGAPPGERHFRLG